MGSLPNLKDLQREKKNTENLFDKTWQFLRTHEIFTDHKKNYDPKQLMPINVAHARALISFASEHGIDTEIIKHFHMAANRYFNEHDATGTTVPETNTELITRYADLCTAIRNNSKQRVTGHSIIESQMLHTHITGLRGLTITLLILGMSMFAIRFSHIPLIDPLNKLVEFLYFFEPSLWGSLGSCVFILKRVYDEARTFQFDSRVYQSWRIRVVIGFTLAPIVNFLADNDFLTYYAADFQKQFKVAVIAFLTGLGVKIIYGALEALVDSIAGRFSLDKKGSHNQS